MRLPTERSFVVAAFAVATAGLLCAVALARALTFTPTPTPADALESAAEADAVPAETVEPRVPSETTLPLDALQLAVDQDPFQPDRRRPEPYRLPGEDIEREMPVMEEVPRPPFRIIGTAVAGDAGLAIVQEEDGAPRVVAVGETVSGFRLTSVVPEAATVMRAGEWVTLMVESPSATAAPANNSRRRNTNTNSNAQNRALTEAFEQMRQRGFPPEMIEQLMRTREQAVRLRANGRGNIEIRPGEGGDVMIFRADSLFRGRGRGGQ